MFENVGPTSGLRDETAQEYSDRVRKGEWTPERCRHIWQFLRQVARRDGPVGSMPTLVDVFFCQHCLAEETRAARNG